MALIASTHRRLVPVSSAAEYAACSSRTIWRRISDSTLTAYRLGPRVIRVDLDELDELLTASPETQQGCGRGE